MCKVLPALHCISGCGSTSGFFGIGKAKALQQLEEACQQLVCQLFDSKYKGTDINELQYRLFCRKQSWNDALPPRRDSLNQHIKRANYQSMGWKLGLGCYAQHFGMDEGVWPLEIHSLLGFQVLPAGNLPV